MVETVGNGRITSYDILLQQLRKKEDADTLLKVFLCLPNFADLLIQRQDNSNPKTWTHFDLQSTIFI